MKNLYASDTIVGTSSDDLNIQMREICRCLSIFIDEQKSFNRHIEERLTTAINSPTPSPSSSADPMFNQLQQQVLTQGLIVNLNTAYREIAVLQSEINALQSENNRLSSSVSFEHQYHQRVSHSYSEDNFDQVKSNARPQPRSRHDEHNHSFDKSSKTSASSQSTGKQTAIRVTKIPTETISNDFPKTLFDIQPSVTYLNPVLENLVNLTRYLPFSFQDLDNIDLQTLDLQIKSIMVQLIP